ncbi:uncharacterized protein LOC132176497 [Corylus avellana]|uniref:uncharacterized protein LOC132176497 n=1 Tax=Corylus avellana TaxID=13451 RepID=UPI00286AEAE2|nr:uncharacterized protein LOC132176497 [Corylus avellana]
MILRCLCFLDQLSFRGVCKQWRSASQNFPAQYGRSAADDPLWLMISRNSTATKWEFGDPSTSRMFTIDVPDLCRSSTRLVLSNHGWLLVFSSEPSPSLFFFNPFSRARIDLPWTTDFSGMTHMLKFRYRRTIIYDYIPVFALSAPPTSPDCVVYAITYIDEDKIRINFCRRGDSSWSTRRIEDKIPRTKFAPIKNAMVHAGILYWVEKQGEVRAYTQSEKGEKYRHFKRDSKPSSDGNVCSYVVDDWEEGKVSICVDCKRRRRQVITLLKNIEDPIEIEKLRSDDDKYRLNLKRDGYATPAPSWLRLDSFPVGSWCLSSSSSSSDDNGPKFCNWHRLKTNRCPSNCGLSGDSVWIEPKWIEPSLAIAWSS